MQFYGQFANANDSEDEKKKKPSQVASEQVKASSGENQYFGQFAEASKSVVKSRTAVTPQASTVVQSPTKKEEPKKQTGIFDFITGAVKKVGETVKNLISPQKETQIQNPNVTTALDQIAQKNPTDDYKKKQEQYLKFPSFFPNPDFSDAKTAAQSGQTTPDGQKKLEGAFKNPIDTAIKSTQDFLVYHPKSAEILAGVQNFIEKGLPNDVFSQALGNGVLPPLSMFGISKDDPLHRSILKTIQGVNTTVFGSSNMVKQTFEKRLYKAPKNMLEKGIDAVLPAIGAMLPYSVGTAITNAAAIPLKIGLPLVFATVGQLSDSQETTVKQRLLQMPVDALTGFITHFIPGTRRGEQTLAQFAGKTFARANATGAVFGTSTFLSELTKGMKPEDAAKAAGSAYITGMLFYTAASSLGYLGDELLGTKTKQGTAVFTPEDLTSRLRSTGLDKTPNGKEILTVIEQARKDGKNVSLDMQAFREGILYKAMGVDAIKVGDKNVSGGVGMKAEVTDAAPKIAEQAGAPGAGVPEIVKTELNKPKEPAPLNIPNLDSLTNKKIEELNIKDVKSPAPEGMIRVYQASPEGKPTDYVFKSPEELANFMNNRTNENEKFRYIDVPPEEVQPVEGKDGVYKVTTETAQKAANKKFDSQSTQLDLPDEVASKVTKFANSIPDSKISVDPEDPTQGREKDPHITVAFGIDESITPEQVHKLIGNTGPITVTLGKTSIFENEKYDVLKADVTSPELTALNKKIRDNVNMSGETFKDYAPHVTIAYLKKGEGAQYAGKTDLEGQTITLEDVTFSKTDGEKITIPLGEKSAVAKAPEKPINDRYYIHTTDNAFMKVEGTPVDVGLKIDAFIHKSPDSAVFVVSEGKSGHQIASGDTREIAITNAKEAIKTRGEDIQKAIDAAPSESPRYKRIEAIQPLAKKTKKPAQAVKDLSEYYANADEEKVGKAWFEVMTELEIAEPGKRIFIDDPNSSTRTVAGISSTFPAWVPEELRRTDLFNKVLSGISDPTDIKYPPNSKPRQQALYDTILGEIDQRAELDSKELIAAVKEAYGQQERAKKTIAKSPVGSAKGSTGKAKGNTSKVKSNREPFAELETITDNIQTDKIKVVEFPELLRFATELMGGNRPLATSSARGQWRGVFRSGGLGQIELKADIFKTPGQAAKTLSHEIGHLIDYLPDQTMARGNILGRIATLREFMRGKFSTVENEKQIDAIFEQLKPLQAQRRALKGEDGVLKESDKAKDLDLLRQIRPLNARIKELQKKSITNPVVRKELMDLSAKWRPVPDGEGTAVDIENDDYRSGSDELYADAISVLFNDPVRLKKEAPTFWRGFFTNLDQKPVVKEALFALYDLLNGDPEKIFQARNKAMDESFKNAEDVFYAKEVEMRKVKSSLLYQIQVLFNDKNQAIIDKVKEAQIKGVVIEDAVNPMYDMAGLNYLDGKLKNYINDTFQPVFSLANSVSDGWNTLGKILQLERTIYERGEFANPGGYDPKTARDQLTALEKHTDKQEWETLQKALVKFREAVQKFNNEAEKTGYYKPEVIEKLKANPAYATYQVVDYLDTYISAAVKQQKGTLKDIANPATSTVMKMISLKKAIERNKVKTDTMDLLLSSFAGEIELAKTTFSSEKKPREFIEPKDKEKGLVIVIRNGESVGYYVDKNISNTLGFVSNDTIRMAARVMRIVSGSTFYRPLFTGLNLGFQSFNFVRDFMRYWKNVPDYTFADALTSFPRVFVRYAQAIPHAANRALGNPDEIIKAMENSKMLSESYNNIFHDPVDPEDKQIERVLQKVNVLDKKEKRGLLTPIYKVLESVELFGSFIESLPKVAGYIELKGKMQENELANFVRNMIGSPDFRTSGTFTPISNSIYLFSNAIKEGMKSDFKVATGKSEGGKYSQSGFWWKNIMSTVLPKYIMLGLAAGLGGKWLKDRMDDISEYDKTNYTVIPLGVDETGKTVYIRIPMDEMGRLIGGFTWKLGQLYSKKEMGVDDLMQLFAFGAGNFPNLSPNFTGIGAIMQYASGQNPYDSYRNRNVIPDREFQAGFKYSAPIFFSWLLQNQGLGVIIPSYVASNPSQLQKVLGFPVISNVVGRWIKASDYGQTEKLMEVGNEVKTSKAQSSIKQDDIIKKAVESYGSGPVDLARRGELQRKAVKEIWDLVPEQDKNGQKMATIRKDVQMTFLKGEADANLKSIMFSTTNEEKARKLKAIQGTMSTEEFVTFQQDAIKYKVLSPATISIFRRLK